MLAVGMAANPTPLFTVPGGLHFTSGLTPRKATIVMGGQARMRPARDAGGLCSPSTLPAGTSTFAEMYASDGNHPSNAGTYLEGLIIASSITGETSHDSILIPGGPSQPSLWLLIPCLGGLEAQNCKAFLATHSKETLSVWNDIIGGDDSFKSNFLQQEFVYGVNIILGSHVSCVACRLQDEGQQLHIRAGAQMVHLPAGDIRCHRL